MPKRGQLKEGPLRSRRQLTMPDHPLAGAGRLVLQSRAVLYARIGPGRHPCHWCGTRVEWKTGDQARRGALVADHVDGDTLNDAPENLVPSCPGCNISRSRRVRDDECFIIRRDGSRLRARPAVREFCGTEFAVQLNDKRPNSGRFCSRACMYAGR